MATGTSNTPPPKQELSQTGKLPSSVDEITVSWIQKALGPSIHLAKVCKVLYGTATKVLVDLSYDKGKATTSSDGAASGHQWP